MKTPSFDTLQLDDRTLAAIDAAGYTTPTEIQHRTIPEILAGKDVLATAQTGTGKTAAFVLPMLQQVKKASRDGRRAAATALILTPTRELAVQITDSIRVYGKGSRLRAVAIYGGASRNRQITELRSHPDILVATPGRLLDLIDDGYISLRDVSYLVLDEADRMLDMGFIPAVRKIIGMTPDTRQTSLFSATMPKPIQALAKELLVDPVRIQAESGELKVDRIAQSVMYVDQADKLSLLPMLIRDRQMFRVLVFTRTKHRARKVEKLLSKQDIPSDSLHGDKSQAARTRALTNFKTGKVQVLVATDVASRGIDVDDITHVVNFELPNECETYVHRIGRTARAGAEGDAISFCDSTEMAYLRDIERLIDMKLTVDREHPYHQERRDTPPRSSQRSSTQHPSRRPQQNSNSNRGGQQQRNGQSRPPRNGQSQQRRRPRSDDQHGSNQVWSDKSAPKQSGQNQSRPHRQSNHSDSSRPNNGYRPKDGTGRSGGSRQRNQRRPQAARQG